jgi:hypothetical protein
VDRDFSGGLEEGFQLTRPRSLSCRHHRIAVAERISTDRRDLDVPSSASLWGRHASALRHEKLQARHDDMLEGANAQAVANLLTRHMKSAAVAVAEASVESNHA